MNKINFSEYENNADDNNTGKAEYEDNIRVDENVKDNNKELLELYEKYGIDLSKSLDIHGIIVDLNFRIDKLSEDFQTLQEHILALARRLDESGLCERNQICIKIKEILKEKIKQGKITAKWIEECLPSEYKRKYTNQISSKHNLKEQDKSEVSSLLSNKGNEQNTILIAKPNDINSDKYENYDNKRKGINSIDTNDNDQKNAITSLQKTNFIKECSNYCRLNERNQELEEITSNNIIFENTQNLQSKILKISVEKINVIQNALNKSIKYCIVKFDDNGWLHDIIPDSLRDIEKREVFKIE